MRVLVFADSGSGKSTYARVLAGREGLVPRAQAYAVAVAVDLDR
jgi:adenylate kinase family enzyme